MINDPSVEYRDDHLKSGLRAAAIRGSAVVVASQSVGLVVRVISSMILARLLTPADFGLFAMVVSVTSALLIFKDLGLCDAIIQSPSINDSQLSTLFWINLGASLAMALILVALSPLIGWFYHEPKLVGVCIAWSLVLPVGGFAAQHVALLKRGMFFFGLSVLALVGALVANGVAIFMAWRGAGYWSLVFRDVGSEIVLGVGAWLLCAWRPGLPSRQSGVRPLLAFGGHTIVSFIIKRTIRNLDRTLLGWRFGAQVVGYYHNAFELAALPASQISEAVRSVAVSALSKLRDDPRHYRGNYLKAVRFLALVGFAATAFFVIESPDVIVVLLGRKWLESAHLFGILSLNVGVLMIYLTHVWLHFSLGRADRLARWSAAEAGLMVIAFVIGLPFGATGVAWAYTVAMFFLTISGLWYAGLPIGLKVSEILQAVWRPLLAASIASALTWYLVSSLTFLHHPILRILSSGICLLSIYVPLIAGLAGRKVIAEFVMVIKKAIPFSLSPWT